MDPVFVGSSPTAPAKYKRGNLQMTPNIRRELLEIGELFYGELINKATLTIIKDSLWKKLEELVPLDDKKHIKLDLCYNNNGLITIMPYNLFTFLLVTGTYVPNFMLDGKEKYETNDGIFYMKDRQASFGSKTPLTDGLFTFDFSLLDP